MAAMKQGKFWEMHDKLFENQKALKEDNFVAWAEELGLDTEKFKADMKDAEIEKKILADQAAAVALGATGTPAFFVNGVKLSGAKPFEEFQKVIDAEIAKVDEKIAAGMSPVDAAHATMAQNSREAFDYLVRLVEPKAAKQPKKNAAADKPKSKDRWKVAVHGDEPMKGNKDGALVTIAEWSEFQ